MTLDIASALCTCPQETDWNYGVADYHILYAKQGNATFASAQDLYHITAQQVLVIGLSNRKIKIIPSEDFEYHILTVNDPQISELIRQYLPISDKFMRVIPLGRQQRNISQVLHNLNSLLSTSSGESGAVYALLEELLVRLHRACVRASAGMRINRNDIVSHLQQHLLNHCDNDFNLRDIAARYNISPSYLAHTFKRITGTSIMRYLLSCRIFAAKEYLAHTELTINAVCIKCGFTNASNFGRTFRREVGCTPRQYRQMHTCTDTQ